MSIENVEIIQLINIVTVELVCEHGIPHDVLWTYRPDGTYESSVLDSFLFGR